MTHSLATTGRLAVALAAGGAFAFGAWRAGLLTRAAAAAAGLLGGAIVALGGAAWAVPTLVFFGSTATLSALGREAPERHGRPERRRDFGQVGANGGVAGALLFAAVAGAAPAGLCFWGFVGAFAAAAADTWATELGSRFGGAPRSLRTGRRVEAGASGAVSGLGTLAAGGGALVVSASAAPLALLPPGVAVFEAVLVATGAGFFGAAADSLAGAFLQARYRHAQSGRRTEARRTPDGARNRRVQGLPGLGNDGVNLLCTAVGAAAAIGGIAAL